MSEVQPSVVEESSPSTDQTPDPGPEQASVDESSDVVRFDEMVKHKEAAEQKNQQWEKWGKEAQPYVARLEAENKALKEVKSTPPAPVNGDDVEEDAVEATIADAFGRDDPGIRAKKNFDLAVDYKIKKAGLVSRDEAIALAQHGDAAVASRLSSVANVSNTLQNMMAKGMLNKEGAGKIHSAVQSQMQTDPQLAARPEDVKHLTKSLYTEMLMSGAIEKPTFQAPTNPLQPSGGSAAPKETKVETGELTKSFGRLSSMDPKRLEAAIEKQKAREGQH
jgi:hypothetical protein